MCVIWILDMYISRIQITHIANSGLNSKTAFHTYEISKWRNDAVQDINELPGWLLIIFTGLPDFIHNLAPKQDAVWVQKDMYLYTPTSAVCQWTVLYGCLSSPNEC